MLPIFNFFNKKKKNIQRRKDKVWYNKAALLEGLIVELEAKMLMGETVFVLAYFKETLNLLNALFEKKEFVFKYFQYASDLSAEKSSSMIWIVPAEMLKDSGHCSAIRQYIEREVNKNHASFVFAEHYPILGLEEDILNNIGEQVMKNARVGFYLSLDSSLLKLFGGESIMNFFSRLSIKEDEALEHSLIDQSVERAQKKIADKVRMERKADSMESWFSMNLPPLE